MPKKKEEELKEEELLSEEKVQEIDATPDAPKVEAEEKTIDAKDAQESESEIPISAAEPNEIPEEEQTVTVQPVKFASFEDLNQTQGETNKNLDILMDIKLQLTVELGRTELPIKKVLELTRGSIIELEKVAGEPVELYANGKLVAHGEVVVIEDNFGLRITSITEPEDRLKGI